MFLLDKEVYLGIFRVTATILQENFFYSEECLKQFIDFFNNAMQKEYEILATTAHVDLIDELEEDAEIRKHFTCYFVSYHLHTVLVNDLHFTDMELDAFENILPRYIGEQSDVEQSRKRANH